MFQIAVYTGPDGEPACDRLFTLDPLYESVEDAIANEQLARWVAEGEADRLRHVDAKLALRVESVEPVVWL